MKKTTRTGRTRITSIIAGFAVAAGIALSGPFIHPPTHDGSTTAVAAVKPPVDRLETFDWI
ncbi:hypothetical protein [Streptomyces sp. PvR034]|uniref:hypothetical protein n=1 Tax=Streptomyces sp. PvR034 TaxID=3156401 RepID=UPI0033937E1F